MIVYFIDHINRWVLPLNPIIARALHTGRGGNIN